MNKTEIKKRWSLYGSGLAVDTPVEIGYDIDLMKFRMNHPDAAKTLKPLQPTVYYKVVRVNVSDYGDNVVDSTTEYIYFYLYFPVDTNHLHDWTGGMIEVVDGVAKRIVCRKHWNMVVTEVVDFYKYPYVVVTSGDHSLIGGWSPVPDEDIRLFTTHGDVTQLNYNLVKYTKELSAKVQKIADEANITHETTWGDRKAMVWCRWHWYEYHKLCKEHGAYSPAPSWKIWAKQFPDPSEVYDKYPALFWAIMERIGK